MFVALKTGNFWEVGITNLYGMVRIEDVLLSNDRASQEEAELAAKLLEKARLDIRSQILEARKKKSD